MRYRKEHYVEYTTTFTCAECAEKLEASPRSVGVSELSGGCGANPWLQVEWQIKPHTCAKGEE